MKDPINLVNVLKTPMSYLVQVLLDKQNSSEDKKTVVAFDMECPEGTDSQVRKIYLFFTTITQERQYQYQNRAL